MDKAGKKTRDIAYHSAKNGGMVTVHSEAARAYSKYLEERSEINHHCFATEITVPIFG